MSVVVSKVVVEYTNLRELVRATKPHPYIGPIVPFFSRTVGLMNTVNFMKNLHDRVLAMHGRAERRKIGHW